MREHRTPAWASKATWGLYGSCVGMAFMAVMLRTFGGPAASDPSSVTQLIVLVGGGFGFMGGLIARQDWISRP